MLHIHGSNCNYLFGREPQEIFTSKSFSCVNNPSNVAVAETALELLMKVNRLILDQKDGIALLDPNGKNNQCHLYSLKVVQVLRNYQGKSEEEKKAKTEENRFLHLTLFLSFPLTMNTKTYPTVVKKLLNEKGYKKQFKLILQDEGLCREKAARRALNELFQNQLVEALKKERNRAELHNELCAVVRAKQGGISEDFKGHLRETLENEEGQRILHDELYQLTKEPCLFDSNKEIYTYPKLAGVAYFIDRLVKENIPFIFKQKVLTQGGSAGVVVHSSRQIEGDEPVIVFEGVITDGSPYIPYLNEKVPFVASNIMKYAKHCNSYFHGMEDVRKTHGRKETCFYCKAVKIDLSPYQQRLEETMSSPKRMLYALGADFIATNQKQFLPLFQDNGKNFETDVLPQEKMGYPMLRRIFAFGSQLAAQMRLNAEIPSSLSVFHVYPDNGLRGMSKELQQDMRPHDFVEARGM